MHDMDKAINELEHCIQIGGWMNCRSCEHKNAQPVLTCETLAKEILVMMKEQPKIVRCKDCKECYFASNRIQSEQTFACGKHGIDVTQDWFCADGEKAVSECQN